MSARGRYSRWSKRTTLDELLDLDAQSFAKKVGFKCLGSGLWSWHFGNGRRSTIAYQVQPGAGVRLLYNHAGKGFDYTLDVLTTPCHFGGRRYWWVCPHCDRRCRILYCRGLFVCRQCSGAYYKTQATKDPVPRIDNELNRLCIRLGAQRITLDKIPDKPKGMQWRTYMRMAMRIADLQYWRLLASAIDIAKLGESLGIPSPASIEDATEDLRRRMGQRAGGEQWPSSR